MKSLLVVAALCSSLLLSGCGEDPLTPEQTRILQKTKLKDFTDNEINEVKLLARAGNKKAQALYDDLVHQRMVGTPEERAKASQGWKFNLPPLGGVKKSDSDDTAKK